MIHGHGDDAYRYGVEMIGDFSSNVPYINASLHVARHLAQELRKIQNYPDPSARCLTDLLTIHHSLDSSSQVLVTNGSAEGFYLLAHYFANTEAIITYPSFAEYEDACTLFGHKLSFVPIGDLPPTLSFTVRTLWFALPNNPNGVITPLSVIRELCYRNPHTYIIIDNAYGSLCPDVPDVVSLHREFPNLITVHSLTKTFAIPGLRLGYIIASEEVIEGLQRMRTPWSVNSLALSAGEFIIRHYDTLLPDVESLCRESQEFQSRLAEISDLEVIPSPCSFFLCKLGKGTAAALKEYLVEHYRLLIRNADNFRGLTPSHFRLSVQGKERNMILANAIEAYLKAQP